MYYGEEGEEEEEEGREKEGRRDRLRAVIPLRRRGDAGEVDGAKTYRGINQPGTLICAAKRAHTHIAGVVVGYAAVGQAETCRFDVNVSLHNVRNTSKTFS